MEQLILQWWHHGNLSNEVMFGLPLFAWNRIAKFLLLVSASVILLDIAGAERVEHWFTERHEEFGARIEWYKAWRLKIVGWITNNLVLQVGLLRYLFSKRTSPDKFTQGRTSRPLAIGVLVILVISLGAAALAALGFFFTWQSTPFYKLVGGIFIFGTTFIFWSLICLGLLLGATALLLLINVASLRLWEKMALLGARVTLQWMRDKGAAHAIRTFSLVFLLLGFVLDLLTS